MGFWRMFVVSKDAWESAFLVRSIKYTVVDCNRNIYESSGGRESQELHTLPVKGVGFELKGSKKEEAGR